MQRVASLRALSRVRDWRGGFRSVSSTEPSSEVLVAYRSATGLRRRAASARKAPVPNVVGGEHGLDGVGCSFVSGNPSCRPPGP